MKIIFGSSGSIGKTLADYFSKERVIQTHYANPKKGSFYFDLESSSISDLPIDYSDKNEAFICSALASPDLCKSQRIKSQRINVDYTKKLIIDLIDHKIKPIFFSSAYVFDGKEGGYEEEHPTNPNTIYGRQKVEIEEFLKKQKSDFIIARISKVYGLEPHDNTLLTQMVNQLKNDETLKCANDQIFSLINGQHLAEILDILINKNISGIYNMAMPQAFSRYDIAMAVKSQLNITLGRIEPCSLDDFIFLDNRPKNISLNPQKILDLTGFKFPELIDEVNKLRYMK